MAKRSMVLLGMMALLLTTALPAAFAQQQYAGGEVAATGVIIDELPADVAANGTHSISDEATGTTYALRSAGADLDPHVGERITVYGTLTPGQGPAAGEEFGGSLPSIDVTRVEPAGGEAKPVKLTGMIEGEPASGGAPVFGITDEATGERYILDAGEGADYSLYEGRRVSVEGIPRTDPNTGLNFLQVAVIRPLDGPLGNDTITASFELAAECEPPAGTTFYGLVGQQPTELADPDGDGLYEGALTLTADFGTFPIPVAIIAGDPADPQGVIEDFGEMVIEDGDAFSASVSFCDDGTDGGNGNGGNGNGGSGGAVVSGDTSNVDKGGSGSVDTSGGTEQGVASPIASVLPATGGILPVAGAAGALLIIGGLVARRIFG